MLRALYSAASGMMAQQQKIDAIAHNLANVNTTGYKKGRVQFEDLLYARIQPPLPAGGSAGIAVGQGVRVTGIHRIHTDGKLQETGNDLDLAIQGHGFFRVQRADGSIAYTRSGSFHRDAQGRLATASGDLVLGPDGPITLPETARDIAVTTDGMVTYTDPDKPGEESTVTAGQITLAVFTNPAGLATLGGNLWGATTASGEPRTTVPGQNGAGRIAHGYLEGSNVETVEEMVNLIVAQRAYEMNSRVIQSSDEMMSIANNVRRG